MPKRTRVGERLGVDALLPEPGQGTAPPKVGQLDPVKMTIYLTYEQKIKLRRLTREREDQGQVCSIAQIIREAIDRYEP